MPVVFRDGGLRYFYFSNEGLPREPRHIHVKGGGKDAKIWLEPQVATSRAGATPTSPEWDAPSRP